MNVIRLLRRAPLFTTTAILTLALGIGPAIAVFTIVNAVLFRPLPFGDPDRLMALSESHAESGQVRAGVLPGSYLDWRERSRSFRGISLFWNSPTLVTNRPEPVRITGATVTPEFFEVMAVKPLLGRTFPSTDEALAGHEREIVISHALWLRWFGTDPGALGRTIEVQGRVPLTIVGVMPQHFRYPRSADFWRPEVWHRAYGRGETDRWRQAIGRLKPGVEIDTARRELLQIETALAAEHPETNRGWTATVDPLAEVITGAARAPLVSILAAVALVFLIACVNVATLVLQRGLGRQRELATRLALGAGSTRLVRESLIEHAVLAAGGLAAGGLLAFLMLRSLAAFVPEDILRLEDLTIDARVVACLTVLAAAAVVITGAFPVVLSRRLDAATALRSSTSSRAGRARWRALVIAEVTLAVVLLASAGLMVRTMLNLQRVEIGVDLSGVTSADLALPLSRITPDGSARPQWDRLVMFYGQLIDSVETLPGIERAALVAAPMLEGREATWLARTGTVAPRADGSPEWRPIQRRVVTPGYFEVLRLPLARGRSFSADDQALEFLRTGKGRRPGTAIVNRAAARYFWPGMDPLRQTLTIAGDTRVSGRVIVGVVGDARDIMPDLAPQPTVYVPFAESPDFGATLLTRAAGSAPSSADVRARLRASDALLMVGHIGPLADTYAITLAPRRFVAMLLILFASFGLVLCAVGLYGLIATSVTHRLREFAIRAAIGATPRRVKTIVLGEALLILAIGLGLGAIGAYAGTRLLRSQLFGVDAADMATWIATGIILCGVGLASAWLPARRASHSDPASMLRID